LLRSLALLFFILFLSLCFSFFFGPPRFLGLSSSPLSLTTVTLDLFTLFFLLVLLVLLTSLDSLLQGPRILELLQQLLAARGQLGLQVLVVLLLGRLNQVFVIHLYLRYLIILITTFSQYL
jgi:hypothetical protein